MRRNLRSTRKGKDASKDYLKLSEGSPLPEEPEVVAMTTTSSKKLSKMQRKALAKKSKQQQEVKPAQGPSTRGADEDINSSGDEMCDELLLENVDKPDLDVNNNALSDNSGEEDEVIKEAEKRLRRLRKESERLQREEKLRKIAAESERLEKSIKSARKGKSSKKPKSQTTTNEYVTSNHHHSTDYSDSMQR